MARLSSRNDLDQEIAMTEQASSGGGSSTGGADDDGAERGDDGVDVAGGQAAARPGFRLPPVSVLPWAFLTALLLIAIALFWSSCEAHYRNCVDAIGVRTQGDTSQLGRLARQDVNKCTRSPF
jgi:hypothetical protein